MKKIISIVLAAFMIVALCACTDNNQPTEPPTEAPTEDRSLLADDALFEGEKTRISYKGNCSYSIYYEDAMNIDAVNALQNALYKVAGARPPIKAKDPSKASYVPFEKLFIVGSSQFEGSKYNIDTEKLGADGFVIKVVDGNIILYGATSNAAIEAVYTLVNDYFGFDALRDRKVFKRTTVYVPQELDRYEYRNISSAEVLVGDTPITDFVIRINNSATEAERTAATYLRTSIKNATGVQVKLLSDLITPDAYEYEILVGSTRREAASGKTIDRNAMSVGEYVIWGNGKKILLAGKSSDETVAAVYSFVENQIGLSNVGFTPTLSSDGGKVVIPADLNIESQKTFSIVQSTEFSIEALMANTLPLSAAKQCFSDETYINAAIQNLLSDVSSNTKIVRCILSNYTEPCDCENCKAAAQREGTDYGAYYEFINKLADQVKTVAPQATLEILAYKNTYNPPKTALRDNVSVLLCNKHLCSAHALDDKSCAVNSEFVNVLNEWKKVAKSIYIIDCTSDYTYYPVTFPNWNAVYDNVRFYAGCGISGVYYKLEAASDYESMLEFRGLRQYLVKQMSSNINVSRETFSGYIDKYLKLAFGDKGKALRSYMDKFAQAANTKCYDIYSLPSEILPITKDNNKSGADAYDLTLAKEFFDIWDKVTPYNERVVANDSDIGIMMFRYQCDINKTSNISHAKVQFNEWLLANVDTFDSTDVVNKLIDIPVTE